MSTDHLAKLPPRDRITMRIHGWAIVIYSLAIGYAVSWVCTHLFMLRGKAWLWPITTAAIYYLGFALSFYLYVKWWETRKAEQEEIRLATTEEMSEFIKGKEAHARRSSYFEWMQGMGDVGGLIEAFPPLGFILFPLIFIGLLYFAYLLPIVFTDLLADLLAELLIESVLGLVAIRIAMGVSKSEKPIQHFLNKFNLIGVFLIAIVWGLAMLQPTS